MTTQQIAWTVDGENNLAILYPNFQTPPYTADWNIIDLTISKSETIMALTIEEDITVIHHSKEVFPLKWDRTSLKLDKVLDDIAKSEEEARVEVVKIDASPDNTLYLVLNNGKLGQVILPEGDNTEAEVDPIGGIENVMQVSAAPDGLVWVVCGDPKLGSVVKWMDPKNGKWNLVPDLINAVKVTGGPKGKAFIINSDAELANYTKKGAKTPIPCNFRPRELSIGPDGRLWVLDVNSTENQFGGSRAHWTDDDGKTWTPIDGSNANYIDAGLVKSNFNEN